VPITDDTITEGDEIFTVTLSDPAGGATLGAQSTEVVTIVPKKSGGGGCSLSPAADGTPDPTLPVMMLVAGLYLLRRRLGWKA